MLVIPEAMKMSLVKLKAETAMTDALAAIDKIEDNAASSQNIVQAEKQLKKIS
ncbi:hypothetical protein SDC49_13865 [Lactobacillus sp. R2/2]|nr:hypothetical protein [Lactobacillus sp. R2/2]